MLAALSLVPQTGFTQNAAVSPNGELSRQDVEIAGGVLRFTKAGAPYLQFPEQKSSFFPNGDPSNRVWLVSYLGRPAVRIPAQHISPSKSAVGNLLITADTVLFNPYLVQFDNFYPAHGKYSMKKNAAKIAEDQAFTAQRADVKLEYSKYWNYPHVTHFTKKAGAFNVGFPGVSNTEGIPWDEVTRTLGSGELERFVRDLVNNFEATVSLVMNAASISDVDRQLPLDAHYLLVTADDFPKYAELYQDALNYGPKPDAVPSFAGQLAQVVSNGLASADATATGNLPRTGSPSSSAVSTTGTVSAMGAHYSGIYASYVNMMLSRSVNWSCSPYRPPATPTRLTCQRDGFVYQAQQAAVAAECSAQTGHMENAATDANATLSALRSAGQLCGAQAPTGPVKCDTDAMISCAQLPR